MWFNPGWGGMWFGGIFWLIIIGLIIWLIINGSKRSHYRYDFPPQNQVHQETPMDILKKRYAKGEITKEEFEQMKKDISS